MNNHEVRRTRERQEVRLRILDAARELFVAGGEETLTLRGVAERIEYSATTIYLHFPNKEALVRELCATDFAAFSRVLKQADRVADPLERLRKVAMTYIDFGLQFPNHYRSMFMTIGGGAEQSPAVLSSTSLKGGKTPPPVRASEAAEKATSERGPYEYLQGAVFKAMAASCFKSEYRDVAILTQVVWCALHGVVAMHLVRSRHPAVSWRPIRAISEAMIEGLMNGLVNA